MWRSTNRSKYDDDSQRVQSTKGGVVLLKKAPLVYIVADRCLQLAYPPWRGFADMPEGKISLEEGLSDSPQV